MLDTQLLQDLFDGAPNGLVVIDESGRILAFNRQAEWLFGYAAAEVVQQSIDLILAGQSEHVRSLFGEAGARKPPALATGLRQVVEGRRKDRTAFPAEVSLGPVSTAKGLRVVVSVRDVSDRVGTAHALSEAEERFRLSFEEAPIGMALVGTDGTFLRVNHAFGAIVGYSTEELIHLTFQEITHPDDVDIDVRLLGQLARGEIPRYQLAKRYIRKDGAIVDIMLSVSVVRGGDGTPRYYIAQVEDISERKRAEEALRRSEEQFRELIERMPDGVVIHSDETIVYANDALTKALGRRSTGELVGRKMEELFTPDDMVMVRERIKGLFATGIPTKPREMRVLRGDGSFLSVETVGFVMHFNGRPAIITLLRDLTERKQAKEALERSEMQLKRAQKIAHLGSWEWDLRTNETFRSDEIYALFGVKRSPEFDQPLSLSRFMPRDEAERTTRVLSEAIRRGGTFTNEYRVIRPDGRERTLRSQGEVVMEEGVPVRIIGTTLDITEQKKAERTQEDALQRLRAIIDVCPMGILIAEGANAEHVEANRFAVKLMGRPVDPSRGLEQYLGDLRTPTGTPVSLEEFPAIRALKGERIEQEEKLIHLGPGRADMPVFINAMPLKDADGKIAGAVVTIADISPFKDLERLRAEWNSVVAHDLRQPLTTIALHAQVAQRLAGERCPQVVPHLAPITQHVARLTRMISDLLDLSRLDAHQMPLVRRPTDVVAMARDCAAVFTEEAPDRTWAVHADAGVPQVMADSDRLRQVMENLLTNAMKYGAAGTPVEIRIEREGERVAVAVTNHGEGISEKEMPHLFQRFQRTASAKERPIKGIGLGLYITRALVEAHGGQITVASTPGETTTFRFTVLVAG